MWSIFRLNVLNAMKSGKYSKDPEQFALFYANEYDKCIKRGGDLLYGVPVINGNVIGMADVIKRALEKGINSGGENFNLLQEIYPAAFDAYWNGAEMAPIPNPILRPLGWMSTPPAPGAVMNIGPNPITLAQSAAKIAAKRAAMEALVNALKNQSVNIPPIGDIVVYDVVVKIINKEPVDDPIKNHPAVKLGVSLYRKYEQAKKEKPGTGSQFKPSVKFPFPKLPKISDLIEQAKNKLIEEAIKIIKEQLIEAAKEIIASTIASVIMGQIQKYTGSSAAASIALTMAGITQDAIKKFVRDKMDGKETAFPTLPSLPDLPTIPNITIPHIPTGEELQKQIEEKIPTEQELKDMAYYMILDKIPKIPNIHFVPPTFVFSTSTNILIDPMITIAKIHLLGTGGMMMVMAQYPPPAPPAPAVIQWSGYNVMSGPPIPNIPTIPPLPSPPSFPPLPSVPAIPTIPSLPSVPSLPSPPAIPTIPSLPI